MSTSGGKTVTSSSRSISLMNGSAQKVAQPPLLVRLAKFNSHNTVQLVSDAARVKSSASVAALPDCVLTLLASSLKCVVRAAAPNSLSGISRDHQLLTISLEEISKVDTSEAWLTINYAPGACMEWALKQQSEETPKARTLSLTVVLATAEECFDVMEAILAAKMRLRHHVKWLEDRLPLPDKIFVSSVTAIADCGSEMVLAQCPAWQTCVALPSDWCTYLDSNPNNNNNPTNLPPPGTISVYIQTHLGHCVAHLTPSTLAAQLTGVPVTGDTIVCLAELFPHIQTEAGALAKHNSETYHTGTDLHSCLTLQWLDLSSTTASAPGTVLHPTSLTKAADVAPSHDTAQSLASPPPPPPTPELSVRHMLIAVSFLIAVLSLVIHQYLKQGKMSSGFLLLDLAAGVSLVGMAISALPILTADAHEVVSGDDKIDSLASLTPTVFLPALESEPGVVHEWALVLVQCDVMERDIADVDSSGLGDSLGESCPDSESEAINESPMVGKSPRASSTGFSYKVRKVQSSALSDANDIELKLTSQGSLPIDGRSMPLTGRSSVIPMDVKQELLRLFPEPCWHPPHAHAVLVDDMVQRFYIGCKGDMEETKRRLLLTKAFREKENINTILERPHPHFFEFKRVYEHSILNGRSKKGSIVTLERVGGVRKAFDTMISKNIPKQDLMNHMLFLSEYYSLQADDSPMPGGKLLKIMDIQGLGMYDVFGNIYTFLYECTNIGTMHYPERLQGMMIINAPTWINMIWKAFTPAIDPGTRERIQLCGSSKSSIFKMLSAEIAVEDIPEAYGGSSKGHVYDNPLEKQLHQFVRQVNSKHGAPTA